MKFELYTRVCLLVDRPHPHYPKDKVTKGSKATIVEHHPVKDGEDGYSLELPDPLNPNYVIVISVAESEITLPMRKIDHVTYY